jgi:hypothetical protein
MQELDRVMFDLIVSHIVGFEFIKVDIYPIAIYPTK